MDKIKIKEKIENDPDFINYPKFGNSLKKAMDANPNGLSDETIQKMLLMTQEEIDTTYESAIMKLRTHLGLE
jgi:hypothetical protein